MKRFNYLAVYGLMFTAALAFTGCSDDDDEGGAPKADNSYITTVDGDKLLLTSNGEHSFEYNSEGILTSFGNRNYSDENYKISFNPCKITDDNDHELNFRLNGAGFISEFTESFDRQEGEDSRKGVGKASYSYDGSGHLTKVVTNYTYSGTDFGESYYTSGKSTTIFTWKNGNLVKAVTNYEGDEDGDKFYATDTFILSYGDNANPLGQFSQSLERVYDETIIDDSYIADLCFVGFFGKPSNYFPQRIEEQSTESDGYNDYYEWDDMSYFFNSNGTLAREYFYGSNYYYSYSNAPYVSRSAAKAAPFTAPQKRAKRHGFFHSYRNR